MTTFTYDELGRLTSENSSSETTSFSWNALGQLDEIASPQMTATYAYGATGMREQKVVDDGSTVATTKSFWIGQQLAAETHSDGRTYQYLYGPSGMPLEVRVTDASGTDDYAFLVDHGGSVIGLSNDSGDVVVRYSYDPWGEPLETDHASGYEWLAEGQPLRYRGYYFDEESGQYYLPARYYSSEVCRFLSADPAPPSAGDPVSLNAYLYCGDDPVNRYDPAGAEWWPSPDTMEAWLRACDTHTERAELLEDIFGSDSEGAKHYRDLSNPLACLVGSLMPTAPDRIDLALDSIGAGLEGIQLGTDSWILSGKGSFAGVITALGVWGFCEGMEQWGDRMGMLYVAWGFARGTKSLGDVGIQVLDTYAVEYVGEDIVQLVLVDLIAGQFLPSSPLATPEGIVAAFWN